MGCRMHLCLGSLLIRSPEVSLPQLVFFPTAGSRVPCSSTVRHSTSLRNSHDVRLATDREAGKHQPDLLEELLARRQRSPRFAITQHILCLHVLTERPSHCHLALSPLSRVVLLGGLSGYPIVIYRSTIARLQLVV
jgi:hypothetical protein